MSATFLIIGADQAAAQAIDTLSREGFDGRLVLVGDKERLPYQRPPLSKGYLSGEMSVDRLAFKHQGFYDEHRVELNLRTKASDLDCIAKQVTVSKGEQFC